MILSYSLISALILGFGYLAYRFGMAGESQHNLNRKALQVIYGVALIAPIILVQGMLHHPTAESEVLNIQLSEVIGEIGEISTQGYIGKPETISATNLIVIIYRVYIIGVVMTAIYFIFGLVMLLRIIRKGEKTDYEGYHLILVDDNCKTAPFSWGHSIVMTRRDYQESGDMILLHEYAHLSYRHWLDVLTAYVAICLQWYNPAAWAMREDLKAVHEYQADEMVLARGVNVKEYQMLLLNKAVGYGYQSLANSLNHSKLRKRVTMMYKKKTPLKRKLFGLILVPAIGAAIAVTSIPSVGGVFESLIEIPIINKEASSPSTVSEKQSSKPASVRKVYESVDESAVFPEGMVGLMNYLGSNVKYPEEAAKKGIQGRVFVKFVVETDGTLSDFAIATSVSTELDKEALRVVKGMPKWTPAKINGKAVASYYTLPISFRLH